MSTRDEIIDAARELLWEKGYVATSPRDIQKRASVGQGSMYHHFAGKEEIAFEAISRSARLLREQAEKDMPDRGSAGDRIDDYLRRPRPILQGCRIGRLTQDSGVMESERLRRPVEESFRWAIDRMIRIVREGIEAGEFLPVDPVGVGTLIVSSIQGGYVLARALNSEKPFHDAVNGISLLLDRIRADGSDAG